MSRLIDALREIVVGNRILAHEDVVDAFGHVSLRHPDNPEHYLMARSRSPELVTMDDIMEFTLQGDIVGDDSKLRLKSDDLSSTTVRVGKSAAAQAAT